ncbi:MAG: response regulator transcription factor [Pseudomonadota bacterium]
MIKVLIADDHSLVRAGLRRIIEESKDIKVTAEAEDGRQALTQLKESLPDVAVIDISMPGMDGFELIEHIKESAPDLPIIVLTMHEEDQYVFRAIKAGAKGYVTKRSAPEQITEAIKKVYHGGRYLTQTAAEALAVHVAGIQNEHRSLLDGLSNREVQVLRRLALGQTNREIADSYNISVKTVDTYRLRLLKKLNLRNNADLSRFAIQHNLIEI